MFDWDDANREARGALPILRQTEASLARAGPGANRGQCSWVPLLAEALSNPASLHPQEPRRICLICLAQNCRPHSTAPWYTHAYMPWKPRKHKGTQIHAQRHEQDLRRSNAHRHQTHRHANGTMDTGTLKRARRWLAISRKGLRVVHPAAKGPSRTAEALLKQSGSGAPLCVISLALPLPPAVPGPLSST